MLACRLYFHASKTNVLPIQASSAHATALRHLKTQAEESSGNAKVIYKREKIVKKKKKKKVELFILMKWKLKGQVSHGQNHSLMEFTIW